MAPVEVVIRFSAKRTWSFMVGENEKLGPTFQRFSDQCDLGRDALVFRENFRAIANVESPLDLHWICTANIDAVEKTNVCDLLFRRKDEDEWNGVEGFYCVVSKSERFEPAIAHVCERWGVQRDGVAFCLNSGRVFGDDTAHGLNLQRASVIWLHPNRWIYIFVTLLILGSSYSQLTLMTI